MLVQACTVVRTHDDDDDVLALEVFVDGSAKLSGGWPPVDLEGGFAAVIFARHAGGKRSLLGGIAAPVVLDPLADEFLGATRRSCIACDVVAHVAVLEALRETLETLGSVPPVTMNVPLPLTR